MTEPRILVLIPARMAATRLPGKPLLDIGGLPMIVHVLRRAEEAKIGRVAVATDTPEIAAAVKAAGGEVVMTRADHPSGSDRIHEAMRTIDPEGRAEIVVNLQGDFPTINPDIIRAALPPLADPAVDIATLASQIHTEEEDLAPSVVKAVGSPIGGEPAPRALFHPRHRAPWRRPALPPHRPLRLPPRRAGTVRGAAPVAIGAAGEARAAPRAGGRNADRHHHRRQRPPRRRHPGRPRNRPQNTSQGLIGC